MLLQKSCSWLCNGGHGEQDEMSGQQSLPYSAPEHVECYCGKILKNKPANVKMQAFLVQLIGSTERESQTNAYKWRKAGTGGKTTFKRLFNMKTVIRPEKTEVRIDCMESDEMQE